MKCKNCGNKIHNDDVFCEKCGKKVNMENEYTEEMPVYYNQPNNFEPRQRREMDLSSLVSEKNKPLGAWAFFGYSILFVIPVIGLIFNLIFCFNSSNITRRNYARSYWCWYAIVVIVAVIVFASGVSLPFFFN